jgi:signal transduction histidine kinase
MHPGAAWVIPIVNIHGSRLRHLPLRYYVSSCSGILSKGFNSASSSSLLCLVMHFSKQVAHLLRHRIGNPLSGINTSLQVLLNNISIWPQEKMEDYIKRTIKEINRLSIFLNRIRVVSNENLLEIKVTNLHKLIQTVFIQNEELLKQKKIKLYNNVEKDIEVFIDEGAFHQIIFNLLNNSIKILQPHEKIEIYVEEKDELFIKLVYRNNGTTIPEELLNKIFYPLYTTTEEGKGIGLAVSKKLMTRMGGTMKAIPPEDGIGAKFMLYVPNRLKP